MDQPLVGAEAIADAKLTRGQLSWNYTAVHPGYDEPRVGLDYEGRHHSDDRGQYVYDIGRAELVERQNWIDIRVVAEHTRRFILHRACEALTRRGWAPPKSA